MNDPKDRYKNCTEDEKKFWNSMNKEFKNSKFYEEGLRIVPDTYDGFEEDVKRIVKEIQERQEKIKNKIS